MSGWQNFIEEHKEKYVGELSDFLSIPSISSLSEHADDVRRAGEWVAERLRKAGMDAVEVMPTGGHPVVYGQWLNAPGKPTVLIYGHFDVQPADPLELWTTPPFEPDIRDERIYARGASDDKGNMLIPIIAVEALLRTDGALPVNLKFLFEGQEEIGSPQLSEFLKINREVFGCDVILNADSGQWSEDQPSLLMSLRGLCRLQVDVTGADSDLHSGMYGGAVQNPIHAKITCRLVADQDPEHINRLIESHIRKNIPAGVKVDTTPVDSNANPYLMPVDLPGSLAAIEVLSELYGKKPILIREGGSVPILSMLLEHLGTHATCFGFGMNDEKFHAPDEFFRLKSFELGQRAYCKILHRLGEQ